MLIMPKIWLSPIFDKNFFPVENAGNMPEVAVFVDLHRTNILLLFHTKTLFITMRTIKRGSIVSKTDFCSWNSLKVTETADFCRKSSISWISWAVIYICSWNFAHWCKCQYRQSPIFNQCTFPDVNAGNIPEKLVFSRHLLMIYHQFLLIFCSKMRNSNC